ncbi:hypothetical protein ACFGVR_22040 [Mucilaginibacter sp. AW1-3]
MMKKLPFLLFAGMLFTIFLSIAACTKVNKDQPCGTYNGTNQILYKDSNGNCYYLENESGKKVSVPNSTCNC